MEISTGVYVGNLSARVRDLLWKRICDHSGAGEATMVFSAHNEQGFSFYVQNTTWKPTDYEGVVLMKKPLPPEYVRKVKPKKEVKRATKKPLVKNKTSDITETIAEGDEKAPLSFVAIDLETTGLKSETECIIELAAVKYENSTPVGSFNVLVKADKKIPGDVTALTGIDDALLESKGLTLSEALVQFLSFIGDSILVGHYIRFDIGFLKKACARFEIDFGERKVIDTVSFAKKMCKIPVSGYRLETLVQELGIADKQMHRALPDAKLAGELYLKLNENG